MGRDEHSPHTLKSSRESEGPQPEWSVRFEARGIGKNGPGWGWWLLGVGLTLLGILITWGLTKGWF
jgi:hypothetical protein